MRQKIVLIIGFFTNTQIDNIGIRGCTHVGQKILTTIVLPPVIIDSETYDFKSNPLLLELTWHWLVRLVLLDPYIFMLY